MRRIYLDYAASTPVAPEIMREMAPYFSGAFGNPESLHVEGQKAIRALDLAREAVARTVGADFREIVFTSSATEANNLALRGAVKKYSDVERPDNPNIIVSSIEHDSVLETARDLEREGIELRLLPVASDGTVRPADLERLLDAHTLLVSVMYVNNVTGAIQPIADLAKIVHEFRKTRVSLPNPNGHIPTPLLHADAAQAFLHLDCNVGALGIDMMTLSSHKIYGPKGAASLYVRNKTNIQTVLTGGHQESGLRAGTQNIPAIVGYASALELAARVRKEETRRITALRTRFLKKLRMFSPRLELHAAKNNAPHIINVYLPELPKFHTTALLDTHGLAVSSGSACTMHRETAAPALLAMGIVAEKARASIRISLGRPVKTAEIDEAVKRLDNITKARKK